MRAALAARVSTRDKNQDPELQLVPMREFAAARGWTLAGEYVDFARASDFVRRTEWRPLAFARIHVRSSRSTFVT